jgi:LuxR family maltose regulon positive regulatory protein
LDRLEERAPLTLLHAPLGFGKTTLAAQWLRETWSDEVAVWVTLRDPAAFWSDLVTVLDTAGLPSYTAGEPRIQAARVIAATDQPLVVVIDSFERAGGDGLDRQLLDLLRHICNLRLIVCLRGDQAFRTHDRIDIDTTVITATDLRLSRRETFQLLTAVAPDASARHSDLIRAETDGWPEVTRAVGVGLRDSPVADVRRAVVAIAAEHLRYRLLPTIPEDRLGAVLATSLPDTFSLEMAHVLGDGDVSAVIELKRLAADGMFQATTEDGETVYSWSPCARRTLATELTRRSPDHVPVLHSRLARWYLLRDQPGPALRHARAAADWPLVIQVIDRAWRPLFVTEHESIFAALSHAPLANIAISVRALALRDLQEPDDRVLDLATLPVDLESLRLLGRGREAYEFLDTGLAVLAALRRCGHFDRARTYAHQLGEIAAGAWPSRTGETISIFPVLRLQLGVTAMLADDVFGSFEPLRHAYERAGDSPHDYVARDAASKLALAHAVAGDAKSAAAWLGRHDEAPESASWMRRFVRVTTAVARVLIAVARLDIDAATIASEQFADDVQTDEFWAFVIYARTQLALHTGSAFDMLTRLDSARAAGRRWLGNRATADPLLTAAEADLLTALGRGNQARAVLRAAGDHPMVRVSLARIALLAGQTDTAARLATDSAWSRAATPRARLEMLLIHAIAAHRSGNFTVATEAVRHAISTAQAIDAVWAFTTVPRSELAELAVRVPGLAGMLSRLVDVGDVYPAAIALVELTRREQLVLSKLADGSTVQQIATSLFVSPNTVKTQLRSIYQKLNVDSRHGAIVRAREWGLLLG